MTPSGGLFGSYFLSDGVKAATDWPSVSDDDLAKAAEAVGALLDDFSGRHDPNEAETERDLIEPLLRILGWSDFLAQQSAARKGRGDVPGYQLFPSREAEAAAGPLPEAGKYRRGASILEAGAWAAELDRSTSGGGAPSTRLLRCLGRVEGESQGAIRFGLLTNGRHWRLYDRKARSRLDGFVEIDLFEATGRVVSTDPSTGADPGRPGHLLRLFLWLFGAPAFVPDSGGRNRLEQAVAESRSFEARVTRALADTVFETVFPKLAKALAAADHERPDPVTPHYLAELREAALTWLYRLLFVLYAEDRDLLPTRRRRGGLRRIREHVAQALDRGERSSSSPGHDGDLRRLWRRIDRGDQGLRLPPYDGGLFKPSRSPLLERSEIPDTDFAPLLDALSRERVGGSPRLIDYRDLDVQHLGSVYERLVDYDLIAVDGEIGVRPQTFARKTSGSYYTPDNLVMLVIRRTVGPLLEARRTQFRKLANALGSDPRPEAERLGALAELDPASLHLTLKICDPAMGSGHFLVSLVDYLADEVIRATEDSADFVDWADYRSPLPARLEAIRNRILAQSHEHGWAVFPDQLVDRQLVRRMILKRVVHGVDKNPMAVELAKLSLWLHTFTVGAPLSFLDHHLRCGDSLFGEWVRPALDRLARVGLFESEAVRKAELAIGEMNRIEELADADIVEAGRSAEIFEAMQSETAELQALLNMLQGFRWIGETDAAVDLCNGRVGDPDPARARIAEALSVAGEANFFHWQVAFPGVWKDWEGSASAGGFDAVIGNPPWDRLKMQEVEWFAARKPEIAYSTRAADRKRMVAELRDGGDGLAIDYEQASRFAGMAARTAGLRPERGGQYPLLGGGDVNLYSLFVERAARLVHSGGMVGLLVPSGISGDLGASEFFRSVSTTGRLASLLDFANRPVPGGRRFFEDVDSRFKFSAIAFGGAGRTFGAAECGFFLTATDDEPLAEQTFRLEPGDFAAVNPNSGTAPIFRTPRDAELVTAIYGRVPVLADHRVPPVERPWRVRYSTMFHMTNHSRLFRTAAELEADGWHPAAGGHWRREKEEAVRLYVGRMFHQFDHRAANVGVNAGNLHNPALSDRTNASDKADPDFLALPQFWVSWSDVAPQREWTLAFRDVTNPTNERTMIAALLPRAAFNNKAALLLTDEAADAAVLAAALNAFVLDFVARSKIQGTNANRYIVEQLPILPPAALQRRFGSATAMDIVVRDVLRLTYTAWDLAAFARDLGHVDGAGEPLAPFPWDEGDRRQRRARLDALFFHLYGMDRGCADYILSTFPIVRRHDEARFGRYLTRDLILAQMNALAAGDHDIEILLPESAPGDARSEPLLACQAARRLS